MMKILLALIFTALLLGQTTQNVSYTFSKVSSSETNVSDSNGDGNPDTITARCGTSQVEMTFDPYPPVTNAGAELGPLSCIVTPQSTGVLVECSLNDTECLSETVS